MICQVSGAHDIPAVPDPPEGRLRDHRQVKAAGWFLDFGIPYRQPNDPIELHIVRFFEKPLQSVFKAVLGVSNEQNAISAATYSATGTQAVRRVSEFRGQEFRE
jgi:hypothetical protein